MTTLKGKLIDTVSRGVQFELVNPHIVADKLYKSVDVNVNGQWIRVHLPYNEIVRTITDDLKIGLRDYREAYPDANFDDVLGYIAGYAGIEKDFNR